MSFFNSLNVSASGMTAQRLRTDIISQNIANVNTTRGEDGEPYARQTVVFSEKTNNRFDSVLNASLGKSGKGVKVTSIVKDKKTDMKKVYDPSHPDADEDGYVTYPNVDVVTEMTNMIDASRAYEANVTAFNSSKAMLSKTLELDTK
ncbi:MAG: flagellar basal body rod protein FlgC [Lachnospiraceae bacterium]|nr:flagellar basal body rod protein FlgC [Lachnospiraceae bacterium]